MAHFAEINGDGIVQRVVVIADSDCLDSGNNESESVGIAFCRSLFGVGTNWVQTSYNNRVRHRYAGVGMKYDSSNNVFYPLSPYPSWTLNETTWAWDAPVALPSDAGFDDADNPTQEVTYTWDEDSRSWGNRTVSAIP